MVALAMPVEQQAALLQAQAGKKGQGLQIRCHAGGCHEVQRRPV
jgi:hypothetical protein